MVESKIQLSNKQFNSAIVESIIRVLEGANGSSCSNLICEGAGVLDRKNLEIILKMANGERVVEQVNSQRTALSKLNRLIECFELIQSSYSLYLNPESFSGYFIGDGWVGKKGGNIGDADIVKQIFQYNEDTRECDRRVYRLKPSWNPKIVVQQDDYSSNRPNRASVVGMDDAKQYGVMEDYMEMFQLEKPVPFCAYRFWVEDNNDASTGRVSEWYLVLASDGFKTAKKNAEDSLFDTERAARKKYYEHFGTLFTSNLPLLGLKYKGTTKRELDKMLQFWQSKLSEVENIPIAPATEKQERYMAFLCNGMNILNPNKENKTNEYLKLIQDSHFNKYQASEIIGSLYDPETIPEGFSLEDIIKHYGLDAI